MSMMLCRVMDAFLVDGMEIIFRLAVAILTFGKDELLSLDMEGMLKVISNLSIQLDVAVRLNI